MGSRGSGRFTDFPGSRGDKSGSNGGDDSERGDRCGRAFSVTLEDIEHSTYYQNQGTAPPAGTEVHVVVGPRVSAATTNNEVVGNLPTHFNYLAACVEAGFTYVGIIRDSSDGPPVAEASVDFAAVEPTA